VIRVKLKDVVHIIGAKIVREGRDFEVKHITADSRSVIEGSVFVCIKGTRTDGHEFAAQAVKNGAQAVICERDVKIEAEDISIIHVENSKKAYALLASAFHGFPSRGLRVVGVTGTNGKTTTTFLLESIFRNAGMKSGLIGTVVNRIGETELPVTHTTPEPFELQSMFRKMLDEGVDAVAMEVSSHAIDQERIAGTYFDVVVFTNLTQDHLDYHLSMDEYARVKMRLFVENPGIPWVVNLDDDVGKRIVDYGKKIGARIFTYGLNRNADICADEIELRLNGLDFRLHTKDGRNLNVQLPLAGHFNVYNALAAFGASLFLGIKPEVIVEGMQNVGQVPGRFEIVDKDAPVIVIVDYAHTPDSLEKTIRSAIRLQRGKGKLITVFGCGGDRDKEKRPRMGRIAAELSSRVIVTSDNPRSENPEDIVNDILKGISKEHKHKVEVEIDRKKAIDLAVKNAEDGDVVLIAGKGHETYQIFADRIIHFDDREVAREALRSRERRIVSETS
jgi:UDP-N-acetylmuramoyl-L-alanyl-D-glutamate--2,6-diaminopimelate ligase